MAKTKFEWDMIMEKYIEESGITYELRSDYYYPMFELPKQTYYPIGKYDNLRFDFLRKHRHGTYATLLMNGELNKYRHITEQIAKQMLETLMFNLRLRRN